MQLRERLAENKEIIDALRAELAQAKAKIDRMELVLMPLSSQAGAAYASPARPRQMVERKKSEAEMGWNEYLSNYLKTQEELELQSRSLQRGTQS